MSWLITGSQKVNWDPSLITTDLWLDAADASTVTLDNDGYLSELRDKSGNSRHATQASAILRPNYTTSGINGAGSIVRDRGHLNITLPAAYAFWFYLGIPDATVNDSAQCVLNTAGLNPRLGLAVGNWLYRDGSSALVNFASFVSSVSSYAYYADNQTHFVSRNGEIFSSRVRSGGLGNFNRTMSATTSSVSLHSRILIGIEQAPSLDVISKIQGWAHWTSGLTSLLPSGHPYKNSPPVP
jgi:hypothetical protein